MLNCHKIKKDVCGDHENLSLSSASCCMQSNARPARLKARTRNIQAEMDLPLHPDTDSDALEPKLDGSGDDGHSTK